MKRPTPSLAQQLEDALMDAHSTAFYPVSHLNRKARRSKEHKQAVADCQSVYEYLAEDIKQFFKEKQHD